MSALPKQSYANLTQPLFTPFGSGGGPTGSIGPTGTTGPTGSAGSTGPTGASAGGGYYSFRATQGTTFTGGFVSNLMSLTEYAKSGSSFLTPTDSGSFQITSSGTYRIDCVSGGTECEETESSIWVNIFNSVPTQIEQSVATGGQGCYGGSSYTIVNLSSGFFIRFYIRNNASITISSTNDFRYQVAITKLS